MKYTFVFSDGVSERDYNTTFEAYEDVLNAFNMYEEYFIGAKFNDNYVNILKAEEYLSEVGPVKEYLEIASLGGFDDSQICEDIRRLHYIDASEILPSWKQHMDEYMEGYERYLELCDNAETPNNL